MAVGEREQSEREQSERRDPLIGTLVGGKYRVESTLARGGMGRIYHATQEPLERRVALKVVQGDGANEHESQYLKRFLQEASILAKLQHPNIVTLHDYGRIEGGSVERFFIAMEFLDGETLAQRLKSQGRLSVPATLVLARQIIRGLREAHKHGIIHRDLKPSNIILVPDGDGAELVKLVDFGIGKMMSRPEEAQDLTQDGVFVGTPRYMAPEQFEGLACRESDLYALGTILFQALAGRLPFLGANMADFMVAKLARPMPTIREATPDVEVPESVERFVQHLLERAPEDRPTVDELQAELAACEDDVFGGAATSTTGSGLHVRLVSGPYSARARVSPSSRPALEAPVDPSGISIPPTIVGVLPAAATVALATSEPPAPRDARPPRRAGAPLLLLLLIGLVVLGVAAGFAWTLRPRPLVITKVSVSATPPLAPPLAPAFVLTIESAPLGATVTEGERALGVTPLEVTIDRASVVAAPRTFTISKEGFAPTLVVQGPASENARSTTALAPLPPQPSASAKPRPTATVKAPAPTPTGTTDIRLKR